MNTNEALKAQESKKHEDRAKSFASKLQSEPKNLKNIADSTKLTSIILKEPRKLGLTTLGKYTFPIRRPYAMPAQSLDSRREERESESRTIKIHERILGMADTINIFLGPNTCCRNPPRIAIKMGGISSKVPGCMNI